MEPRSVYELFEQVSTANPNKAAFRHKKGGRWIDVTWSEQRRTAAAVSRSLLALDVKKGDRVAILASTCLRWVQVDSGIVNCGATVVGIYHSNLPPDCAFIINHCEAEVIFVQDETQLKKILAVRSELPTLRQIIVFDGPGDESRGVKSWEEFLELGRGVGDAELAERGRAIGRDDVLAVVYTSGTTGEPKGAMLTHGNLLFTAGAAARALKLEPHYETLLFLPLAHVFARMFVYLCMSQALTVAFAEDMTTIPANLREIRPQIIVSVPRIYEKVHEKVLTTVEEAGGLRQRLFDWATGVGREVSRLKLADMRVPAGLAIKHAIANRLVLRKIQAAMGGRIVWAASGAAPLSVSVAEFFHACGVNVIEGLGMSENTSLTNVNPLERNKLGTVGPVVPGVEMKLAPDGEILFRGGNVMKGYFKNPEATAEVIDADGWLHTGDIGEIDEDGFLKVTDRKKDLIITAGGKNIAPQRIERAMRGSRYISHAVAYGDKRKYITALIALDPQSIQEWAAANGLGSASVEELSARPEVRALIEGEIESANAQLASFETVKKFCILPRDLSIETGELTPTLKIKRKIVVDRHRELLERMYED